MKATVNDTLFIRADATPTVGAGHLMRCLALAQAWKEHGGSIMFITHCTSDALTSRIKDEGFHLESLERSYPDPADLKETLALLKREGNNGAWLVLDGYHFTPDYQKTIRSAGYRLLVLDDTDHLFHYHADILLNQNILGTSLPYAANNETTFLLGPCYVLLRREFLATGRKNLSNNPSAAPHILVTLGGGDPDNVTLKVIRAIKQIDRSDLLIRVLPGPVNPHQVELASECESSSNIEIVRSAPNMPEQMAWADIIISAAGTTCWEQCFIGTPTVMTVIADNQRDNAQGLHNAGIAINLGWHECLEADTIVSNIDQLLNNQEERLRMSRCGQALIDGRGADRVIEAMLAPVNKTLTIRPAAIYDVFWLWQMANDPLCRTNAFSPEPIPFDHHLSWYQQKLSSPDTRIWILEERGRRLAQIRYDRQNEDCAVIDFSVISNYRGKGLGTKTLELTHSAACSELNVKRLSGLVLAFNNASTRAFEKAGYIRSVETIDVSGHQCVKFERVCQGA